MPPDNLEKVWSSQMHVYTGYNPSNLHVQDRPTRTSESGFRNSENFAFGIRNPGKFCLWNPESLVCNEGDDFNLFYI